MEEYKNRKGGFEEMRKSLLRKVSPIMLLALIAGHSISYLRATDHQSDFIVLPLAILLSLAALIFGFYLGMNRQKVMYESFRLTLDDYYITRKQHNTTTIRILNEEVSDIIKNSKGNFIIKGKLSNDIIIVPLQIENYQKLELSLSAIRPISTKPIEPFFQKYNSIISILSLLLMVAVYISKNKVIVGFSGAILLVILGYSIYEIKRSKNLDSRTKMMFIVIFIVLASIIKTMYYKIID